MWEASNKKEGWSVERVIRSGDMPTYWNNLRKMRRFFSLILASSLLLSAFGCASKPAPVAAAPTTGAEIDTSDPSWAPPQDGFVVVEKPAANENENVAGAARKPGAPAVAMPAPNARASAAKGSIHAATN